MFNYCWVGLSSVCWLNGWLASSTTGWWASSTADWTWTFQAWADSPSLMVASSAKSSSVFSEAIGTIEAWIGSSSLTKDSSKPGWAFQTWRRASSKPSKKEEPSSESKASKSRYSQTASSLTWRSWPLRSFIFLSFPPGLFPSPLSSAQDPSSPSSKDQTSSPSWTSSS